MSALTDIAVAPSALPESRTAQSRTLVSRNTLGFAVGVAFGFLLVGAGVHRYEVIRDALLLRDPYVFLLMGAAVATAAPLLYLLRRRGWVTPLGGPLVLPKQPVSRANFAGSAVFGAGWAVTGSCPGPALASVAGGNIVGAWVVGGLFAGIWLFEALATRRLGTDPTASTSGQTAPQC
jgi:uncharacterized membrane protein YedE/YeeE